MGFTTFTLGLMVGTGITLYSSDLMYSFIHSYLYYPHKDYFETRKKLKGYAIPYYVHNTYLINVFRGYAEFWYRLPKFYYQLNYEADLKVEDYVGNETMNFKKKEGIIETQEMVGDGEESKGKQISFSDIGKWF